MDLGLEGRSALVTGASKGIGLGIAQALAAEGAKVAVSSRSRERIEAAAAEIGATPFVHDTADVDAAPGLIDRVEAELGPLDVLVTNSGGPPPGPTRSASGASSGRTPTGCSCSARWRWSSVRFPACGSAASAGS